MKEKKQLRSYLNDKYPEGGLISGESWLRASEPFNLKSHLSKKQFKNLENLGDNLSIFLKACNNLYLRSLKGTLPPYIKKIIESGKPQWLIEMGRESAKKNLLPKVIRPDLLLTDDGLSLVEIDSVPGGIGLTAWLNQEYTNFFDQTGEQILIIGGAEGMFEGFNNIFTKDEKRLLLISKESDGYKNEMTWLANQINSKNDNLENSKSKWEVKLADEFSFKKYSNNTYRFFELFDHENVNFKELIENEEYKNLNLEISPGIIPHLEEKSWLGIFHLSPLKNIWERELRGSLFERLKNIIPYTWIVDPSPIPYNATLPHLNVNSWEQVKNFSQKKRNLILKISGFSEIGWGSKSVSVGSDLSQNDWSDKIDEALNSFKQNPYIMQDFKKSKLVEQKYLDPNSDDIKIMKGRVRLCPYFFLKNDADESKYELRGVLATICEADKKVIHGMNDAILAPCI